MNPSDRYDSLIQYYSSEEGDGLDWKLIKAQIRAESNFDPEAISRCGASGLSQFMARTWLEWGRGSPNNPEQSIAAQVRYMSWLKRLLPSERHALAAYNCGYGTVKKLIGRLGSDFAAIEASLPAETRDYVQKISAFKREYET